MKKVLIFSLVYYPKFIGGAEVAIKEITDRLDQDQYDFDMITLRLDNKLPKVEKIGNVTIHRVGFSGDCKDSADSLKFPYYLNKYLLIPLGFFKALSLHRKNKYDVVWSMMATYNSFAAVLFKMFKKDVKYLLTLQEGDSFEHIKKRAKPLWPIFTRIFTKADHIQVISNYLGEFARDMGYRGQISLVPNAVDYKYFSEVDQNKVEEIKREYDKKDEDVWLITTSRLVDKNAIGDVINAMPKLQKNVKFLILGDGYQEEKLIRQAKDLNLEERVFFLGYIPHDKMRFYLHASDIFIRPSLSEGFGNSYVEAMATRIPVIATEVGGIVDFVEHKRTGLFVGVHDSQDIALKVEMLLRDVDLKEEIIDNADEMVKEKYDWSLVSGQMDDVFRRL
ncbi:MAG: glycosyltransferase involved in cell wall biosynthesis [Candidatus Paceibacteria bacterium]|jgi:glycosyltransferase involved in cell wall biosynthesis